MPELPEVESIRRLLEPAMQEARFEAVIVRRANLRIPFPDEFVARLVGQTVTSLTRRAKYLLGELSSGETLVMHLGMSGWFRVDPNPADLGAHDHVIFRMSSGAIVIFEDVRRFGFMDLVPAGQLASYPALKNLGPEPLSPEFDAAVLARALKRKKVSLKVALLDQRIVAGLGNIYASEALHVARLSPRRKASTLATPTGAPRDPARRLVAAIKQVLEAAIARHGNENYRGARFRVYDREGKPCRRPHCTGTILRRTQTGRSTFYCPVCQR